MGRTYRSNDDYADKTDRAPSRKRGKQVATLDGYPETGGPRHKGARRA